MIATMSPGSGDVLDVPAAESANPDAIDVATYRVGGVRDGLPDAALDVVDVEEHGLGPELCDAGDAVAQRGAPATLPYRDSRLNG